MSKQTTTIILLLGGAVAAYFLWKRYQDAQRAAAHPIAVQSDASLIKPLPVNLNLVTDATIVS